MDNKELPEYIKENISLRDYSSFKIGGNAKYFCSCASLEEIKSALDFAIENKLKVFILGNGSNLLISDKGFDGLVIHMENRGYEISDMGDGKVEVRVGSGLRLMKFILDIQKEGIGGLDWAAGIPASLGGAICNNAGAHGKEMGECVKSVRTIKMEKAEEEKYLTGYNMCEISKEDCDFPYRHSIFKISKDYVIADAVLSLYKCDGGEISKTIAENLKSRREKQPLEYPNVGSIFKNPALDEAAREKFFRKCLKAREIFPDGNVPAGWLIEQAGLKGKRVGDVMVSEKHANFIINCGQAKAEDVVILISLIKQKVRVSFDIQLKEEMEYVGF